MSNRKICSFRACLLQLGEVLACFAAVAFSAYGANSGAGDAVHVESELMWYTTMALDDSTVLVGKFKERFPRINVEALSRQRRSASEPIAYGKQS